MEVGPSRKRHADEELAGECSTTKKSCSWVVEIPTEPPSESEDSVFGSIHERETVYVRDTSDTSWSSASDAASDTSSIPTDILEKDFEVGSVFYKASLESDVAEVIIRTDIIHQEDETAFWADKSDSSIDPELSAGDMWSCSQCKRVNKPLSRYCKKCFYVRRNWFDSRRKRRRRKKRNELRNTLKTENGLNGDKFKLDSGLSSMGSVASSSSQETCASAMSDQQTEDTDNCVVCRIRPKNTLIVHGSIAHQAVCYRCGKKVWRTIGKCPVCQRKIECVVRNCGRR